MMNSPSQQLSEHSPPSPSMRRSSRRTKTVSSLHGMFEQGSSSCFEKPMDDLKSVDSFDSMDNNNNLKYFSSQERDSLRLMSRRLRQAKRKLLLKCVETPVDPVDKLRDILLKISVDASDEFSTSMNSLTNETDWLIHSFIWKLFLDWMITCMDGWMNRSLCLPTFHFLLCCESMIDFAQPSLLCHDEKRNVSWRWMIVSVWSRVLPFSKTVNPLWFTHSFFAWQRYWWWWTLLHLNGFDIAIETCTRTTTFYSCFSRCDLLEFCLGAKQ